MLSEPATAMAVATAGSALRDAMDGRLVRVTEQSGARASEFEPVLPPRAQAEGTLRRLYETALRQFADRGFHAVSVRDLTGALGMQPSSLYAHLPSKQHLLGALIRLGHEEHRRTPGSFDGSDHDVRLAPGSLAARAAGEELHGTKSHHHQGVGIVGEGLAVTGISVLDDLPEALEAPDRRFVLGVQWHPEADERSSIVGALVEEATMPVLYRTARGSA